MPEFMVNLVDGLHFYVAGSFSCHLTWVISSHEHHAASTQKGGNRAIKKKKKHICWSEVQSNFYFMIYQIETLI